MSQCGSWATCSVLLSPSYAWWPPAQQNWHMRDSCTTQLARREGTEIRQVYGSPQPPMDIEYRSNGLEHQYSCSGSNCGLLGTLTSWSWAPRESPRSKLFFLEAQFLLNNWGSKITAGFTLHPSYLTFPWASFTSLCVMYFILQQYIFLCSLLKKIFFLNKGRVRG